MGYRVTGRRGTEAQPDLSGFRGPSGGIYSAVWSGMLRPQSPEPAVIPDIRVESAVGRFIRHSRFQRPIRSRGWSGMLRSESAEMGVMRHARVEPL